MPDFTSANNQEADDAQQKKMQHIPARRYLENYILFRAGFKQTELGLVWEKDGVCYGKEAALQKAYGETRRHSLSSTMEVVKGAERSSSFREGPSLLKNPLVLFSDPRSRA
jgi:hypothetical protein